MLNAPEIGSTRLAVDGRKVMELLEIPPGPEVGEVLKDLLDKTTDHPELNHEEDLVDLLKKMKYAKCDSCT